MLNPQQVQNLKARLAQLTPTLGGKFLYYCLPYRKNVVLKNMRYVFANVLDEAEIQKLALCFYSHLFTSLRESIQFRFMSLEQIKQRAVVIGEENLAADEKNDATKGTLVITGHFGNWEFAPIAGILNFKKFKGHFYFIRKAQALKWLENIAYKRYYAVGLGVISKKNSLSQVYEVLERNQIVIMVMDQRAKGKEGILVDFFGKKASTYRTVAMIARDANVPVIPGRSYRQPDGSHVLEFFPALPWLKAATPQEEIQLNTLQYNQVLEKMILDYPEQWLWLYKRWRNF